MASRLILITITPPLRKPGEGPTLLTKHENGFSWTKFLAAIPQVCPDFSLFLALRLNFSGSAALIHEPATPEQDGPNQIGPYDLRTLERALYFAPKVTPAPRSWRQALVLPKVPFLCSIPISRADSYQIEHARSMLIAERNQELVGIDQSISTPPGDT